MVEVVFTLFNLSKCDPTRNNSDLTVSPMPSFGIGNLKTTVRHTRTQEGNLPGILSGNTPGNYVVCQTRQDRTGQKRAEQERQKKQSVRDRPGEKEKQSGVDLAQLL